MYYESDYLSHHGVKGMKWGVRKQPERKGTGRKLSADPKKKKQYMPIKKAAKKGRYGKAQYHARSAVSTYGIALGTALVSAALVKGYANRGQIASARYLKNDAKFYVNMLKTTAKVEAGIATYQALAGVASGDKKERYLQK